jgi:hypothetical protein
MRVEVKGLDLLAKLPARMLHEAPYVAARSLTTLAVESKRRIDAEMRRRFDRPSPWALRAIAFEPASKSRLSSAVGLRADSVSGGNWTDSMAPQFEGGGREQKRFERRLQRSYVVPGRAATLDRYGNVSRADIRSILRYVGSPGSAPLKSRARRRIESRFGRSLFLTSRGVFRRDNAGESAPLLLFAKAPRYQRRIDLHGITTRVADRRAGQIIIEALAAVVR